MGKLFHFPFLKPNSFLLFSHFSQIHHHHPHCHHHHHRGKLNTHIYIIISIIIWLSPPPPHILLPSPPPSSRHPSTFCVPGFLTSRIWPALHRSRGNYYHPWFEMWRLELRAGEQSTQSTSVQLAHIYTQRLQSPSSGSRALWPYGGVRMRVSAPPRHPCVQLLTWLSSLHRKFA